MVDDLTTSVGPLPPLAAIPPDVTTLADYERRAPAHLAPATWAHIQEAAGSGTSARDNRRCFDRWRLLPRALGSMQDGSTAVDLPGGRHQAPLLLAPLAYQRIAHDEGELAVMRAATALQVGTILSTLSSVSLEEVAAARRDASLQLGRPPSPSWFQLYLQPRREDSLALLRRAEAAGYEAVVLTIDAGVKRSAFALPPGVEAANLIGMPSPRHVAAPGGRILLGTPLADAVPRWSDLDWLRTATTLPILVKGMVIGKEVDRLIDIGVDGLILSNHGGRVMDGLPAALDVLSSVVGIARGRMPVLLDGGVRSGADVAKAICLGARAVLVGRPVMHALAVAGLAGVAHVCHILRAELEQTMVQLGCPTLPALDADRLLRI